MPLTVSWCEGPLPLVAAGVVESGLFLPRQLKKVKGKLFRTGLAASKLSVCRWLHCYFLKRILRVLSDLLFIWQLWVRAVQAGKCCVSFKGIRLGKTVFACDRQRRQQTGELSQILRWPQHLDLCLLAAKLGVHDLSWDYLGSVFLSLLKGVFW